MSEPGNAERWRERLETIIRRYRARLNGDVTEATLTLEQALEATRVLGLTDGESLAYLVPKAKR